MGGCTSTRSATFVLGQRRRGQTSHIARTGGDCRIQPGRRRDHGGRIGVFLISLRGRIECWQGQVLKAGLRRETNSDRAVMVAIGRAAASRMSVGRIPLELLRVGSWLDAEHETCFSLFQKMLAPASIARRSPASGFLPLEAGDRQKPRRLDWRTAVIVAISRSRHGRATVARSTIDGLLPFQRAGWRFGQRHGIAGVVALRGDLCGCKHLRQPTGMSSLLLWVGARDQRAPARGRLGLVGWAVRYWGLQVRNCSRSNSCPIWRNCSATMSGCPRCTFGGRRGSRFVMPVSRVRAPLLQHLDLSPG